MHSADAHELGSIRCSYMVNTGCEVQKGLNHPFITLSASISHETASSIYLTF